MIRLEDVSRTFQVGEEQVHALSHVNLDIQPGEFVAIMGPSGSGKSTLLNLLGLLDRPSSGRYLLEGRDATALNDKEAARLRRERIGFVFQFFHLVHRLTAAANVGLPLMLAGMEAGERRQRVEALLAGVALSDRADHLPSQLSGGQLQRVAIARAMSMHPGLLLADEPTGNLDRATGREVMGLLRELNHQGTTLIVITHDPEVGDLAPRRITMEDGRIISDTTTRQTSGPTLP
jgi:putative ABC transport system ATP-binding protein